MCHVDCFQTNYSRRLDCHLGHLPFSSLPRPLDIVLFVYLHSYKNAAGENQWLWKQKGRLGGTSVQSKTSGHWGGMHCEFRDSLDYIVRLLFLPLPPSSFSHTLHPNCRFQEKKAERDIIRDLHVHLSHFKWQDGKVWRIQSTAQISLTSLSNSNHSLEFKNKYRLGICHFYWVKYIKFHSWQFLKSEE